jgi:Flp pilus assembly protein TadD
MGSKKRRNRTAEHQITGLIKKDRSRYFLPLSLLLVVIAVFVAYYGTLDNSFQFDDVHHIHQSRHIRDFESFKNLDFWFSFSNRAPAIFTLAVNYKIGGLEVSGYHIFNLLIHIAASIAVFFFVGIVLGSGSVKNRYIIDNKMRIQLFSALIFALHPIQTESVTYIVQRMESLAFLFYVLALILYVSFRRAEKSRYLLLKIVGFAFFSLLAILTKQASYSLPLAIVLMELYFIRDSKDRINRKLVASITVLLIIITVIGLVSDSLPRDLMAETSRLEYLLSQTVVIPKYILLLIFPSFQNIDHHIIVPGGFFSASSLLGITLIISLLLLSYYLYRKNHIFLSFVISWFFIMIILRSSVLPISDLMTERRLYSATLSIALLIPVLFYFLASKFKDQSNKKYVVPVILSLITVLFAVATIQRNKVWENELTLWTDSVSKSPEKFRPNYNVAEALKKTGNNDPALRFYLEAYRINPHSYGVCNNIGNIFAAKNDNEFAEKYYSEALRLNPQYPKALNNLANIYFRTGRLEEAEDLYLAALDIDINFIDPYRNLGLLYMITERYIEAKKNYLKVLEMDPGNNKALNNLEIIEEKMKQIRRR